MIKLLGFLDFLAAVLLLLVFFKLLTPLWLVAAGAYLLVKGWIFFIVGRDFASITDVIIGLSFLLFAFVDIPRIIMIIFAVWLFQKSIFSFI